MLRFIQENPWFTLFACSWTLGWLYVFGGILFMRIAFAPGIVWLDTDPPQMISAWYYIPQHIVLNFPLLILAALPWVVKAWRTRVQ